MTDIAAVSLHPSLQQIGATHRRLTRLLSLLFFLAMAGALVFMMTTALSNRSTQNLLIFAVAGFAMLPMMALMWGLLWYLERWMTRRLTDANHLLRSCAPVDARLTPTGTHTKFGMLMTLELPNQRNATGSPFSVLIEPNSGWSQPPRQAIDVHLYFNDLKSNSRLVALHEGKALIGKLVESEAHCRYLKQVGIAVVAVLLIFAVVLGFFS